MNADADATGGYNQLRTSDRKTTDREKQNDQEHCLPHRHNAPRFSSVVTIIRSKNSSASLTLALVHNV